MGTVVLGPFDRSGRHPVLPDLPRRHDLRQPPRRLLPQRPEPWLCLVRVRHGGRATHLPGQRSRRLVCRVRPERPGDRRLGPMTASPSEEVHPRRGAAGVGADDRCPRGDAHGAHVLRAQHEHQPAAERGAGPGSQRARSGHARSAQPRQPHGQPAPGRRPGRSSGRDLPVRGPHQAVGQPEPDQHDARALPRPHRISTGRPRRGRARPAALPTDTVCPGPAGRRPRSWPRTS